MKSSARGFGALDELWQDATSILEIFRGSVKLSDRRTPRNREEGMRVRVLPVTERVNAFVALPFCSLMDGSGQVWMEAQLSPSELEKLHIPA